MPANLTAIATPQPGRRSTPSRVDRDRRSPARMQALLRVASAVAAPARRDALLPALARTAAEAVGAGVASVVVYDEARRRTVAANALFTVVLFDVEALKAANDSTRHLAGDPLLRRVAETIRGAVRGGDLATASAVAARVRDQLLAAAKAVGPLRTTVRYGAAVLPDDGRTPAELIGVADARLYQMRAAFLDRRVAAAR